MKRIFLGILLVAFTCTVACAESSVWKAQKGKSVLYLGGTCHVLRQSDYPLPPEFEKAYRASQVIVFETDIDKLSDPYVQQKMLSRGVYPDGSTIDMHLSSMTLAKLNAYCDSNGIPLQALSHFKPSMLMVALALVELRKLGVTEKGVDTFFYQRAKKDKKVIERFETVDEQLDYILSMGDGNEDDFVTYSLHDIDNVKQMFESLASAWRKGDAAKVDEVMAGEMRTHEPRLYQKLIVDRNRNWLPSIEKYATSRRTGFILVGVGHLVGPEGIIETLKKKGYKVEQM